jgi:uncharacterized protein YuzB (UPF0349 family)
MNGMDIKDYWNPSSPSYPKTRFVEKAAPADDWEIDDEDATNECDEEGHVPVDNWGIYTECGFCKMKLVRMLINGEKVFVDPDELKKLYQWNEMASGGGR